MDYNEFFQECRDDPIQMQWYCSLPASPGLGWLLSYHLSQLQVLQVSSVCPCDPAKSFYGILRSAGALIYQRRDFASLSGNDSSTSASS